MILGSVPSDKLPSIIPNFTLEEQGVTLIFQRDFERSGIDLSQPQVSELVSLPP
ncbi:hypothetical protein DL93DRAFT_2090859 [Clavulina sp. PMI_390]|nr:hypothetical protein DL93DRAFT_2090859 [Clavulina sp. PMI_390]